MSRKTAPASALPVFEVGQRVRLTKPILRYAMMTDEGYVEFKSPIVWYGVGETGIILRKGKMQNYWLVWWGDEFPEGVVEGFAVHAKYLEGRDE